MRSTSRNGSKRMSMVLDLLWISSYRKSHSQHTTKLMLLHSTLHPSAASRSAAAGTPFRGETSAGGQALLELGELLAQPGRHVVAERPVVLLELGQLLAPRVGVDLDQLGQRPGVDNESARIDGTVARDPPDRRVDGLAATNDPLDDP